MSENVIKSAARVLEVLDLFRLKKCPLNVSDVAEHFGYPISSTSVLLKSIATSGYLAYDNESKAYFPTIRVALLGDWIIDARFRHQTLQTVIDDLARLVGETTILAVQNDIYSEYVYLAHGTRAIHFHALTGARRPICMSGTGWALLSDMTDAEVEQQVRRSNARGNLMERQVELDFVLSRVRDARKVGYAFSRDVVNQGAGVIAMPLKIGVGNARYAIGVAGAVHELENRETMIAQTLTRVIASYAELPVNER